VKEKTVLSGFAVVVLDRGFVYVGNVECDSEWCVISNVRNVRRYGTTNGLGELALNGPTKETVLDDAGTIRVPMHSLNHIIDSEELKWKIS
jgi:hypothetical protein